MYGVGVKKIIWDSLIYSSVASWRCLVDVKLGNVTVNASVCLPLTPYVVGRALKNSISLLLGISP
jgi:hypothetical protein